MLHEDEIVAFRLEQGANHRLDPVGYRLAEHFHGHHAGYASNKKVGSKPTQQGSTGEPASSLNVGAV